MEHLLQDLKFAGRLLVKDRAFTATALLTLGICIGANAAIFAIVNSIVLRPLPVPDSRRLVLLYNSYPNAGVERGSTAVPDYYDRLRETAVFEEQALYQVSGMTVGGEPDPQRVIGMSVRPSFFRILRTRPLRGRIFNEDEGEIGRDRVAVLSYAQSQQLFGGADAAIGREVRVNGLRWTVVGVMPRSFYFEDPDVRLWVPLAFRPEQKSDDARHNNSWTMIARLKPGATVKQAQQEIDTLNARNLERFPQFRQILVNTGFHTVVAPLQDDLVRNVRSTLFLLWGGVLFVLAIGAVNVTNLALIRSTSRTRELATRHALGAALTRLTLQLLTESVLLTLAGGLLGLGLGYAGLRLLGTSVLGALPRASEISIDLRAVGFTAGLALVVGMVVGLVPMINLRQTNLAQAFREEGRSGTASRGPRLLRRVLVAAQVALAFMLLIGAGLLLTSFQRVSTLSPGFDALNLLTARATPPQSRYRDDAALRAFTDRLLSAVRAVPGVASAGMTTNVPFGGDFSNNGILAEGYHPLPGESLIAPYSVVITPGYVETMRVPVLRGRTFTASDTETSQRVAIVDERLARKFWPGADPIGRRILPPEKPDDLVAPPPDARWITVVGVVATTKMAGFVSTGEPLGTYYLPARQRPERGMTLVVRSAGDPTTLVPAIRQQLRAIDPELPLYSVRTMADRMNESLADRRTPMAIAIVFAAVALFLAAVGIYGALAYQVSQRRKEIGIRLALGSDARTIFGLIVKEGMSLMAAGLLAGLAGAFAIRRTLEAQLYGVGALDPVVLGSVGAMLVIVAFIACSLPARRATRIDPVIALGE
jgi:predicted permease